MFQRLQKGFNNLNLDFLDDKIAEEQEKQKQQQQTRSGSSTRSTPPSGGPRRGNGRTDSPSKRPGSKLRAQDAGKAGEAGTAAPGPNPDDFIIGDDVDVSGEISRVATPAAVKGGESKGGDDKQDAEAKSKDKAEEPELPLEIQQKLAKLETLALRYQDLLRNYRTAHARVVTIEPFEASLRENTPLTSIADPGALVEFLNQRNLQSDMVMEELKRMSGEHQASVKERDALKIELEEAKKQAKEAFDEAAGLRKEREEARASSTANEESAKPANESQKDDAFFSYEAETSRTSEEAAEQAAKVERMRADHEAKISEMETELKEQNDYINELSTENATMRQDLEITRLDLEAMKNKIGVRDRTVSGLERELAAAKSQLGDDGLGDGQASNIATELAMTRTQLEEAAAAREAAQEQEQEATALLAQTKGEVVNLQSRLKEYQASLDRSNKDLQEKAVAAEENLRKYRAEHAENLKNGKYVQREEKRMETLQNVVNTLRDQVKAAEESKLSSERQLSDFQLESKKLEAEISNCEKTIAHLRQYETSSDALKKKLAEAERERDNANRVAESKKGHEAAVASLRSQLKRAEKDRDSAYQIILDCGKCTVPEKEHEHETRSETTSSTSETRSRGGSETTTTSTQPTEASVEGPTTAPPSVDDNEPMTPGDGKKKNKKKKSKPKKKTATDADADSLGKELTVEDLLSDPELAPDVLLKSKFGNNPMLPLFGRIVETLKERSQTEDANDSRALHLEGLIEDHLQTIRNKDILLHAKAEELEMARRALSKCEEQIGELQEDVVAVGSERDEWRRATVKMEKEYVAKIAKLREELEALQEERETLRDDLLEHGTAATDAKHELKEMKESRDKLQTDCDSLEAEIAELKNKSASGESVSAEEVQGLKEKLASMEKEKENLQVAKEACEKQIEDLKSQQSASGADSESKHKSLSADLDKIRTRSAELETELAAANLLAQTRFKDLTDLRELYNKIQPELKKLRDESAQLKTVKADLEKANGAVKRLEAKEKDLRSEIAVYKSQAAAKDTEISSLREKARKSDERSKALEESYETARRDMEKSEGTRNEALETRDRVQASLKKADDELKKSRARLEDLEQQVKKFSAEASGLRDELQIKAAQQASAQSLMDSMQDQTRELATQMKEFKERNESLGEELGDAHRLLSERGREGETMRRLLSDVEGRAEGKVKEMRERLDLAIEERDRAEDDASSLGRKKAREIEDLKSKIREAEREASRATEAKEDAERRERDSKSRHADLEHRATQSQEEVNEVRSAMAKLSDTLDETERQSRELEKDKHDLRKQLVDRETRIEKLQKSSKSLADELRSLQTTGKLRQSSGTPSRSSMESSNVTSPVPKTSSGTGTGASSTNQGGVDFPYLKTVLLQFLEQKEKKHQMQLVPVLGMLLHFDRQDEQKWTAAISAK